MNKVIFTGRLTKDIKVETTANGTKVAKLGLAVDRQFESNGVKVDFFDIIVWRTLAENCGKYISKGNKVLVEGEVQNRSYEKDGVKRYITEIIASNVEFIDSKKQDTTSTANDEDVPF